MLQVGDRLLQVDEISVDGHESDDVVRLVDAVLDARGKVILTFQRARAKSEQINGDSSSTNQATTIFRTKTVVTHEARSTNGTSHTKTEDEPQGPNRTGDQSTDHDAGAQTEEEEEEEVHLIEPTIDPEVEAKFEQARQIAMNLKLGAGNQKSRGAKLYWKRVEKCGAFDEQEPKTIPQKSVTPSSSASNLNSSSLTTDTSSPANQTPGSGESQPPQTPPPPPPPPPSLKVGLFKDLPFLDRCQESISVMFLTLDHM